MTSASAPPPPRAPFRFPNPPAPPAPPPVTIRDLTTTAEELHSATDNLNAVLLEIEAALVALNLGVYASVPFAKYTDEREGYTQEWSLGFGKHERAWRLTIDSSVDVVDHYTETPICDASREHRIKAVG